MVLFATLSSFRNNKVEGIIMIVSFEVKNFAEWKKGFDEGKAIRKKAGIKVLSVCTLADNPNSVIVVEEVASKEKAKQFIAMLKEKEDSGHLISLVVQLADKK